MPELGEQASKLLSDGRGSDFGPITRSGRVDVLERRASGTLHDLGVEQGY